MHDVDTQSANQDDSTFPDDVDYTTLGTRSVAHFTTPLLQCPISLLWQMRYISEQGKANGIIETTA
jgi:hypothetical protein